MIVIITKRLNAYACFLQECDQRMRFYCRDSAIVKTSTKGTIGPGRPPACLLTLLCHYGKPRLCINIHHYALPVGCSVTHRAASSLAATGRWDVREGSLSSFKSIT